MTRCPRCLPESWQQEKTSDLRLCRQETESDSFLHENISRPLLTLHQLGFIGNFVLAGEHSSTVYLTAVPTTASRRKLLLKDVSRRDRNTEGTWTQHEKTLHKNSSNNNNNNNNTNNNNDNQPPTRHKEIKHYFYIFEPNNSPEIVPQSSRNHQEGIKLFKS